MCLKDKRILKPYLYFFCIESTREAFRKPAPPLGASMLASAMIKFKATWISLNLSLVVECPYPLILFCSTKISIYLNRALSVTRIIPRFLSTKVCIKLFRSSKFVFISWGTKKEIEWSVVSWHSVKVSSHYWVATFQHSYVMLKKNLQNTQSIYTNVMYLNRAEFGSS